MPGLDNLLRFPSGDTDRLPPPLRDLAEHARAPEPKATQRAGLGDGPATRVTLSASAQRLTPSENEDNETELDFLKKALEALSDRLEEKREAADEPSDADVLVDRLTSNLSDSRLAAAEQKLAAAEQKLEMLRFLSADPAAVARQAKQIANEIKAAARDYRAALKASGKSAAAAPAPPQSLSSATAQTTAYPSSVQTASTAPVNAAAAPSAAGQSVPPSGPAAGQPVATAPDADASVTQPGSAAGGTGPESPDQTTPREKIAEAYRSLAAELSSRNGDSAAQREIGERFKKAAREVRQILEKAIADLKAEDTDPQLVEDAEKALDDLDKEIEELLDALGDTGPEARSPLSLAVPNSGATGELSQPVVAFSIPVSVDLLA
ncbi:MAG: hypothetical protein AAGL24_11100 [Pseudomonadota bacterium]